MKKIQWAGWMAAVVLMAGPGAAWAVPVQWTLESTDVGGGGTASGTFTYDADTGIYSNVKLSITGGTTWPAVTFTERQVVAAWPGYVHFFSAPVNGDFTDEPVLIIEAPAFTNAGGSVSFAVGTGRCLNVGCSARESFERDARLVGQLPGSTPTSIPTLSEWGLFGLSSLMALGALVHARRYRSNSGAPRA